MNVTELRPGNYFTEEGNLYLVLGILLNKTAMRKMVAKVKIKNIRTGAITEMSANSGYQVETIRLDKKKMNYLYDSGDFLVFMDNETYEQIEIPKARLEWEINFLKENFSRIIFDGVPINGLPDSLIMASLVDRVVLVTAVGYTKIDELMEAKKALEKIDANIAGVVVNRVNHTKRGKYSNYYE